MNTGWSKTSSHTLSRWLVAAVVCIAGPVGAKLNDIELFVDASDTERRIWRVEQSIEVRPGPLKLWLPQWIPGEHGPGGRILEFAGLQAEAAGKPLPWRRDERDVFAFHLTVPAGADRLRLRFQHLGPIGSSPIEVRVTPQIIRLEWPGLVLYPAGAAVRAISVNASLKLPGGWSYASALAEPGSRTPTEGRVSFAPVSLETLMDSPVYAGRHFKSFDLAPGSGTPVRLNVFADEPEALVAKDEHIAVHAALVAEARALFGTQPFRRYDFLLSLSDSFKWVGLEHHASSEAGFGSRLFLDWDKFVGERDLVPHEFVHAWNGKTRRPAGMLRTDFNTPTDNQLLWVYEGQTQFWGWVLAARSGLMKPEEAREWLALIASWAARAPWRQWRSLSDSQSVEVITRRREIPGWLDWTASWDYYNESLLNWLEVDARLREASAGQRSLDDFARSFFGGPEGSMEPRPYRFEDVTATLATIAPGDWAGFWTTRLQSVGAPAPLGGIERSGWRLAYDDKPGPVADGSGSFPGSLNLGASIGMVLKESDGEIERVAWDGPAYRAGLAPGQTIAAVNDRAFTPEVVKRAIAEAQGGTAPIRLLIKRADQYRTVLLDYHEGLRYPKLERIEGRPDLLTPLLTARRTHPS